MSPVAADARADRQHRGGLAALAGAAARTPFTARAWRELLFCLIEVPLGLCVLLIPAPLVALPLTVTLLTLGGHRSASPGHSPGPPTFLTLAVVFVLVTLVVLVVLTPLIEIGRASCRERV